MVDDRAVMNRPGAGENSRGGRKGFSGWQVAGIVLVAVIATAAISFWLLGQYVFTEELEPVALQADEQREVEGKLRVLRDGPQGAEVRDAEPPGDAEPERYTEAGADRVVQFSQRELNGLLANDPALARRVAVDLSDDLLSLVLLVPVEEGFPLLGGRTVRVHAGVELTYHEGEPVVRLMGVSVMGVPVPNAWLGDLKNVNLVEQFGAEPGFWRAFAAGVADLRVEDGQLRIELNE